MATSLIKQLPKSTVEMEIHIPWEEVKSSYEKVFTQIVNEAELPGFRKGKAPKKLVDEKIDKTKLYEEVVKEVIPKAYHTEIQKHQLMPIIPPKVDVLKAKENEEWVVKAIITLKPKINLKNYKDKIKALKKDKVKIWVPGTTPEKKDEVKKLSIEEIIKALTEEIEVELSDILISQEANRLLTDLIDQTQKLGLTVEQYLLAKGKTTEQIRGEYANQASHNLLLEFALAEIADSEKITVTPEEIDALIAKTENPEARENLKKDSYYLAHLLRQQKTLDFLNNL